MISSQVDADRMDYLQRDSYYTGTNYGKFDLDRVLHMMRPVKDGIAFEINGMHAVEDIFSVGCRCICRFTFIQFHARWRSSWITC